MYSGGVGGVGRHCQKPVDVAVLAGCQKMVYRGNRLFNDFHEGVQGGCEKEAGKASLLGQVIPAHCRCVFRGFLLYIEMCVLYLSVSKCDATL